MTVEPGELRTQHDEAAQRAGTGNRRALSAHAPALAAALAGLAWFVHHVGAAVLDPTNVAWLLKGDLASAHLGWTFFRAAPFALPLGANPEYPFPFGSTLGYSDSLPLVGVLLRPFSAALPLDFQYLGPWLGLCFALQGFVGAKLVRLVTPDRVAQVLGGTLFALAPPLLHRVVGPMTGHASLCAHWVLLSLLWLALAPVDAQGVGRRLAAAGALVLAAAGLHPYHVVAAVALSGALLLRLWTVDRLLGAGAFGGAAAGLVATAAAGLSAFGYLARGVATPAPGFGTFSADLLALVNPLGWSRAWLGLAAGGGQYEGFGYLGAGVLALALVAAGGAAGSRSRLASSRWRAALPVFAIASVLGALSLSDTVTLAGQPLMRLAAYDWVPAFGETFRSTGRFIWSLHYVVLFGAIAALLVAWRARPRAAAAALAGAVAIQIADVRPYVPMDVSPARMPLQSDVWATARGTYRHVAMVPPYLRAGGAPVAVKSCDDVWPWDAHLPAAELAHRLSATFNGGYLARLDPTAGAAACDALRRGLAAGRMDPETIHVVHPRYWPLVRSAGAACGLVDGLLACVDGTRRDPFAEALRRSLPGFAQPPPVAPARAH